MMQHSATKSHDNVSFFVVFLFGTENMNEKHKRRRTKREMAFCIDVQLPSFSGLCFSSLVLYLAIISSLSTLTRQLVDGY